MEMIQYKYENRFIKHSSLKYIFPPMVGMIFAQIAPVVDGICVSNSMGDEAALAAIATVGPLSYIFNIIAALGGIGCGVMLSRCSGSGEKAKAGRIFTRSLLIMVVVSVVISILGIVFADPLLGILGATQENYPYAMKYMVVILAGSVFQVLNFAGDYILANDNNQTLAMAGDITGAIVNIIIDFVGVYVFHQGIEIVAFGTVFGSFCCCLVYLLHFRRPDRLCRIVSLKKVPGDPSIVDVFKPGMAEAVMYSMFAVQLVVQNFVLRGNAGTMGISNSAVIENIQLVITIIIAGTTDAIFPMAAAYDGEQNKSGMLMVKRTLMRYAFFMLMPLVVILLAFPNLVIIPYGIDEPIMLQTLPLAIRIVSAGSVITLIYTLLVDYLSAIEEEYKATLALIIQSTVQIVFTLVFNSHLGMDAPWYGNLAGGVAALIYLSFFCNHVAEGTFKYHQKNLLLLTGGILERKRIEEWKGMSGEVLTPEEVGMVEDKMFSPLMSSLPEDVIIQSTFTILRRDDDMRAVILRYISKEDYIGANDNIAEVDEDDGEFEPDVCIRSVFLGARRLMIVISGNNEKKGIVENEG